MIIPTDNEDYKFRKTLNEDVKLISDKYGKYDLDMDNGDYINITGNNSLQNAIIIAILTRFKELKNNPTYQNFGCRVHELIKANNSDMVEYKMRLFIQETLENMRRIQEVNELKLTNISQGYKVYFKVTSINDEIVNGSVTL